MKSLNERTPETRSPANLANLAKQGDPWRGLVTLADLCRDLAVDPQAARARLSVAELTSMIEGGDIPPAVVDRFAVAVGRTLARARP